MDLLRENLLCIWGFDPAAGFPTTTLLRTTEPFTPPLYKGIQPQMLTFVSGLLPCLPINPQYIWRKTISQIEVVLGSGVFPVLQ